VLLWSAGDDGHRRQRSPVEIWHRIKRWETPFRNQVPMGVSMSEQSYSVDTFAEAEGICRSMVYKLWSQGKGPRFYYVGTVRRISQREAVSGSRAA
jgi:hypothetical protein